MVSELVRHSNFAMAKTLQRLALTRSPFCNRLLVGCLGVSSSLALRDESAGDCRLVDRALRHLKPHSLCVFGRRSDSIPGQQFGRLSRLSEQLEFGSVRKCFPY